MYYVKQGILCKDADAPSFHKLHGDVRRQTHRDYDLGCLIQGIGFVQQDIHAGRRCPPPDYDAWVKALVEEFQANMAAALKVVRSAKVTY